MIETVSCRLQARDDKNGNGLKLEKVGVNVMPAKITRNIIMLSAP